MEAKFSQRVKDVLSYSREEAIRLGNDYIGLEHLLLGIIREGEGMAIQILAYFGVDLTKIRKEIEMYGGVLGGTNNEPKPAAESEEEVDDGVSSNNVLGRSTMM